MNSSINYDKGTNYPSNPDSWLGLEGDDDFYDDFYDDPGHDELNDNAGDNLLNGGPGSDDLYDNAGDNLLNGGPGSDDLYSNAGDNLLNGGPGRDKPYGGPDVDTFVDDGQPRHSLAGNDNINLEDGLEDGLAFSEKIFPRGSSTLNEVPATGEDLAIFPWVDETGINNSGLLY